VLSKQFVPTRENKHLDLSLIQAAEECLEKGISVCRDGVNYRKVGKKIRYLFSTVIPWSLPVS
jgi:methionine aminopeptidase